MSKICLVLCLWVMQASVYAQVSVQAVKINQLDSIIKNTTEPTIINFWATFCKPCVEELPHFLKATKTFKKVKFIFVSMDLQEDIETKVVPFITKRKEMKNVLWLNETDANVFMPKINSSWSGAIPCTIFIHNKKNKYLFKEQEFNYKSLVKTIKQIL
jgi:thiol-disulfide isomerase/thioredoxin